MRIFAEVTGRQTTVELSRTTILTFSVFAGCFFSETLEMRPALLYMYSDMQSIVSVSVISKCITFNDLESLFRVKFCFRAGLAGFDCVTSEK